MIGLFGGTFDPVHYGHLRSALEVKDLFNLDEVRLIPSSVPPHRAQPAASANQRLEMLELAVRNQPGLTIDTREVEREGNSYMADTLRSLRNDFPDQSLILFIGCDAFNGLTTWHHWRRLFDYAHIVCMTRPGFTIDALTGFLKARSTHEIEQLEQSPAGKLFFQKVTQLDISSTAIRKMIAEKRNPGYLLPEAVIAYIYDHKLYQKI
ncbi:MAG: nicotinate-nucleotide adenylyltransferase [Gammaproteobacteria bacterium]